MISWKKNTLLTAIGFSLLLVGILIGIALAKPYFESKRVVALSLNRVNQASAYVKDFAEQPDKLERHLLLDLELNLSKLLLIKEQMSNSRKQQLCSSLLPMIEDKQSFITLANQLEDSETHISRIELFLAEVAKCEAW